MKQCVRFTLACLLLLLISQVSLAQHFVLELTNIKAFFAQQSYPDLKIYVQENKVFNVLGKINNNGKEENVNLRFEIEIDPSSKLYQVNSNIFELLPPLRFNFNFVPAEVPSTIDFVGMSFISAYIENTEIALNYVPRGMTYQWWKDKSGNTNGGQFEYKDLSENRDFKFCIVIRIGTFNENYLIVQYDYTHPLSSGKVEIKDESLVVGKLKMKSGIGLIKRGDQIIEVTDEAILLFDDFVSIYSKHPDPDYTPSGTIQWTHWYFNGEHRPTENGIKWEMIGNMGVKMQSLQDDRSYIEKLRGRLWSVISGTPDKERRVAVGVDYMENACKWSLGSRSVYYIDADDNRTELKVFEGEVNATLHLTGETLTAKEGELLTIKKNDPNIVKSKFDLKKEVNDIQVEGIREVILANFTQRGITDISGFGLPEVNPDPIEKVTEGNTKSANIYGVEFQLHGKWEKVTSRDFPQGALILNDGGAPDGSAFVTVIPENMLDGGPVNLATMSPTGKRTIDGKQLTVYEADHSEEDVHLLFLVFDDLKHKGSNLVIISFTPKKLWNSVSVSINEILDNAKIK